MATCLEFAMMAYFQFQQELEAEIVGERQMKEKTKSP
jgi:hypothetical protein